MNPMSRLATLLRRLLLAGICCALPAAPISSRTKAALDIFVEDEGELARGGFGAVLFSSKGELWAYESGTGTRAPLGRRTPLMTGALSGRFVILAAARMAQERRIDLGRPIAAYLPELARVRPGPGGLATAARLSLGTVAAEASGRVDALPRLFPGYDLHRDLLRGLEARSPRYPADVKQTRSDGMIDLLALALERRSGTPWPRLIASKVFAPAGMTATAYVPASRAARKGRFYYEDGAPYDPRVVAGILPSLTPSGSACSSLADLAALGASLLAACAGERGHVLAPATAQFMFSPKIPGQLDRQGFETGLGWNLTFPALGHLGRVAWTYGSEVTHRTCVVLLPDRGVGLVLAGTMYDPAGPFQLKRLASELIQIYFREETGLEPPAFRFLSTYPPIPAASRPASGLYGSQAGVAEVGLDDVLMTVFARGGYSEFAWSREGRFVPTEDSEFAAVETGVDGQLVIIWRSGARMKVFHRTPASLDPALKPGTCRVERARPSHRVDTVLIDRLEGHWIITGDDGQNYLLLPDAGGVIRVLCDEASVLDGCIVSIDASGSIHVKAP